MKFFFVNEIERILREKQKEKIRIKEKKEDRRIEKKIEKMEKKGDVKGLIKTLSHKGYYFRKCAAKALGRLGDAQAVELLIPLLKDELGISWAAAWALGEIGDARVVDPLIQTLESLDSDLCRAAAEALGRIENARGVKALIQVLQYTSVYRPDRIRMGVARALEVIGDARAVDPLIRALEDRRSAGIICSVAGALGAIGDARTIKITPNFT